MSIALGDIIQLPNEHAAEYLRKMYSESSELAVLYDAFTNEGYQFYFERAKAFLFASPPAMITSGLIGILPSFVEAHPEDAFHTAIGISALSDQSAVATRVTVEHNPFRVAKFELFGVVGGQCQPLGALDTATIARMSIEQAVRALVGESAGGRPSKAAKAGRSSKTVNDTDGSEQSPDSAAATPSRIEISQSDAEAAIAAAYEQILSDDFARPLYPEEGYRALLAQTPLVQKWALINSGRSIIALEFSTCGCSSSCCNGCTTSSCVIHV
jgi:hypothetical protein